MQTLRKLLKRATVALEGTQLLCRVLQRRHRTAAVLPAAKAGIRPINSRGKLLAVAKDLSALGEFFLLTCHEIRPLQFVDLEAQGVHTPCLLGFIHGKAADLSAQLRKSIELLAVCVHLPLGQTEAVKIGTVLLLIEELLSVMLTVDIQQAAAKLTELGNRHRAAIHPADILAVCRELTLQKKLLPRVHTVCFQHIVTDAGKLRGDACLCRTGADEIS